MNDLRADLIYLEFGSPRVVPSSYVVPPHDPDPFDCETALIAPGCQAPPLVGAILGNDVLGSEDALRALPGALQCGIVGSDVSFDLAVACEADPSLWPIVFDAYERNKITDVALRQQLIDIAAGCHFGFVRDDGQAVKILYNLADLTQRVLGRTLEKADTWRLRYALLLGVPVERWPFDAVRYVQEDGRATIDLWREQERECRELGWLEDEHNQARGDFALRLCAINGLRTDPEGVARFEAATMAEYRGLATVLRNAGLISPKRKRDAGRSDLAPDDEKRNTKVVKEWLVRAYAAKEDSAPPTTPGGDISTDALSCRESGDPILETYARFGEVRAVISKTIPFLRSGTSHPIHTRYGLAASGRSTSSPNVQNLETDYDLPDETRALRKQFGAPDTRECFVPRPGRLFAISDYGGLELCTLAQACIDLLGRSSLAEAINAGTDCHSALGAQIAGCTYEEFVARIEAGDPVAKRIRQTCKVANFGFPGGLGVKAFIEYALKSYSVRVTFAEASKLRDGWFSRWSEMDQYLAFVGSLEGGQAKQVRSGRIRGRIGFTDGCNTFFQGLGADTAKDALFYVSRACYTQRPETPYLFGCRPVNFIHDEIVNECPEERAAEAAEEQTAIMLWRASVWMPDVKAKVETSLSRNWSKKAHPKRDANGRLQPWA